MYFRPLLVSDKAPFSCTSKVRPSLLWDIMRRSLVAGCRRFATGYSSYLLRSRRKVGSRVPTFRDRLFVLSSTVKT